MAIKKQVQKNVWDKISDVFAKKAQAVDYSGGYLSYVQEPSKPVWTKRNYARFADEGYGRNVIARRCIDLISTSAASVPWKLNDNKYDSTHPLLELLNNPNPDASGAEFFESVVAYRLISGNSYILATGPQNGVPAELHTLRPDRVSAIAGRTGNATGYAYKIGNFEQRYSRSQVLHLKHFHPLDDYYGMSPIEAAAYSIDQHNQAGQWNQALLQNGAKPSGALVVKSEGDNVGVLSDEQFRRIKQQMDDQYSGAINAGRPLLLEGGLDWKEMSLSPKDMDFIETKNSSARDIALAFGVPPQLLGIPGDNTFSNLIEARLALWEQTVLPLLDSIATSMNNWLCPHFGNTIKLVSDLDKVSALAPRRDALWKRVGEADFLSDDEKRKILGL